MVESKVLAVGVEFIDKQQRGPAYLSGKVLELVILIKHRDGFICGNIY